VQKFDVERFNSKRLSNVEVKDSIRLEYERGLQLWKTWLLMWTSVRLGKVLEYKSFSLREPRLLQGETA
jgi:hypothetical protein